MKIIKKIEVPTGKIFIGVGEKGFLECLSIGDYGKEKNIKADFLGLSKEINGVPHGDLLPLSEKWVITVSTQYGCSMGCNFCDVPKVGPGMNCTFNDLINQVVTSVGQNPEIEYTNRLNLHYARMGEPTFNRNVIDSAYWLAGFFEARLSGFHPVVSTMMPKNNVLLKSFIRDWIYFKNNIVGGEAGLQLSINTTDEDARKKLFNGNALELKAISQMMKDILTKDNLIHKNHINLRGRKITLNFALTDNEIDAGLLSELFDPKHFLVKITPLHMTNSCKQNKLETTDGYSEFYPYHKVESELKDAGFDVIVFIPSIEEDESRITCGNAILSDKEMLL